MKLIAIAGKKGSGKDLLGSYLKEHGYQRFAFGDLIKLEAMHLFDLSREQVHGDLKEVVDVRYGVTPRVILEKLGMFCRQFDDLYWIKRLGHLIFAGAEKACITDVRLLSEVDYLKSLGAKIIRLERDDAEREKIYPGCSNSTAVTEVQLDDYTGFDLVVPKEKNRTKEDLKQIAKEIA